MVIFKNFLRDDPERIFILALRDPLHALAVETISFSYPAKVRRLAFFCAFKTSSAVSRACAWS
jgi:hypothetical protein